MRKRKPEKVFERREDDLKLMFQTGTKQATLTDCLAKEIPKICIYCGHYYEDRLAIPDPQKGCPSLCDIDNSETNPDGTCPKWKPIGKTA